MKTPNTKTVLVASGILLCAASSLSAAGYSTAEITRTFNDVKVLKEGAAPKSGSPGTQIGPVTSVATGADSRAELRFPDQSLTRLGANSRFTLRGDARNLDLDSGVMMLQVPKGVGGAKVRTAAVTAAVTGTTVMFEYQPNGQGDGDGYMKVICVEGSLDLSLNDDPSKFQTLKAGQLSLSKLGSGLLGAPVDVDLKVLLKTSKLLNEGEETPNSAEVSAAVQTQQTELSSGTLVQTNLVIPGRGTVVVVDTIGNILNNLGFLVQEAPPPAPPVEPGVVVETPPPLPPPPPFTGFLPLIGGMTILGNDSTVSTLRPTPTVTAFNDLQGQVVDAQGRQFLALIPFSVYGFGRATTDTQEKFNEFMANKVFETGAPWASFKFEDLFINGTPYWQLGTESLSLIVSGSETEVTTTIVLPDIVNVILAAQNNIHLEESLDGNGEDFEGESALPPPGNYGPYNTLDLSYSSLDSFVLYSQDGNIVISGTEGNNAIYGYNQNVQIVAAGLGSDVRIEGNILLNSGEAGSTLLGLVAGRDVLIGVGPGGSRVSVEAGTVDIDAGNDVKVDNAVVNASSGKLTINAKNKITIQNSSELKALLDMTLTSQGDILIADSSLESGGVIEIESQLGNVDFKNATMTSADIIRARTLSPNGKLTIEGGTFNAANIIKLYAEGSNGHVLFKGNVALNTDEAHIAGKIVEVADGGNVNVSGSAHVFADQHKYNATGFPAVSNQGTISGGLGVFQNNFSSKPDFRSTSKLRGPVILE